MPGVWTRNTAWVIGLNNWEYTGWIDAPAADWKCIGWIDAPATNSAY